MTHNEIKTNKIEGHLDIFIAHREDEMDDEILKVRQY